MEDNNKTENLDNNQEENQNQEEQNLDNNNLDNQEEDNSNQEDESKNEDNQEEDNQESENNDDDGDVDPELKKYIEDDSSGDNNDKEDDDIDDDDIKRINKAVDKRMASLKNSLLQNKIDNEVKAIISKNPEFKKYETKINKYVNHPNRLGFIKKGLPVSTVVYEAIAGDLMKIGASKNIKAQQKADNSQIKNNNSSSSNNDKKDWSTASNEEIMAERAKVFGYEN